MNNGMVQIDIVFDTRTGALQMRRPPNVAPLLAMLILNTAMRGILDDMATASRPKVQPAGAGALNGLRPIPLEKPEGA